MSVFVVLGKPTASACLAVVFTCERVGSMTTRHVGREFTEKTDVDLFVAVNICIAREDGLVGACCFPLVAKLTKYRLFFRSGL